MIQLLLVECPDLLLIKDKRGFSPLNYVPRDSYRAWNEFLLGNVEILEPKGVFQQPAPDIRAPSSSPIQGRYFL